MLWSYARRRASASERQWEKDKAERNAAARCTKQRALPGKRRMNHIRVQEVERARPSQANASCEHGVEPLLACASAWDHARLRGIMRTDACVACAWWWWGPGART
eukprot:1129023-Pleurochrysis_carterae.AAC.2